MLKVNYFPHFFFRKRNVEQRKLSPESVRRQTARSFTKIPIPLRSKSNFLTLTSRQICIGALPMANMQCGICELVSFETVKNDSDRRAFEY
jgi:hypothetical protein